MKYKKPRYVPDGEYEVEVISARSQTSRNNNEMIVLKVSVGPGRCIIFDHLVFTDASDWKIAQCLTAVGIELQDGDDIHPRLFEHRRGRALVTVTMFDGCLQNKIAKWLPPAANSPAAHPSPIAEGLGKKGGLGQ
jgi:Protein of unknown function (DUF669)